MPWYAIIYCLLLLTVGLAGAWDDRRNGQSRVYVTLEILSVVLGVGLVAGFYAIGPLASPLVPVLLCLIFVVMWNVFSARQELRHLATGVLHDPELSASENRWMNWIGAVFVALVCTPAWFFGAVLCWRLL